ncbi:MAG: response regulator receiver domain [Pirellulaceae bacterium]
MTDTVAEKLRPFVTAAFRKNAIRSVVLVDEEFDSLHDLLALEKIEPSDMKEKAEPDNDNTEVIEESPIQGTESGQAKPSPSAAQASAVKELPNAVAKRLYDEMHSANLICDVINRADQWNGEKIRNADLIVLDWHLSGGDDTSEAIGILRQLAQHSRFNLVIIYTNHPDLTQAARRLCGSLRQRTSNPHPNVEVNFEQILDMANSMDLRMMDLLDAFLLRNQFPREVCADFKTACAEKFQLRGDQLTQVIRLLVEKKLRDELGCSLGNEEFVPLTGEFLVNQPWLVYENLFVCFASKTNQQLRLLNVLDESLVAWNPGIPRTIVSEIRNTISRKRHEFDNDFPHDLETQAGWLWYAKKSGCAGTEGVRQLLKGVLRSFQQRVLGDNQLGLVVENVLKVIPEKATPAEQIEDAVKWCGDAGNSVVDPHSVMHALNVFQSSSAFDGDYITTGTILKRIRGNHPEWLVVVEPACNLVPSQGQANAKFTSCRMLELVKISTGNVAQVLEDAVHGRHLFVQIAEQRLYFSIGKLNASLQPIIIDSFVPRTTQFREEDGRLVVNVYFPNLREATPTSSKSDFQIVAQLHEPYANRLLHSVGSHLSRIGLDFVSFPKLQQDGEQPQ